MVEYLSGERIQGYSGTTYYHETTVNSDTGMGSGQTYYAYGSEIRSTFDGIGKKADKWTITFSNNSAEGVVEAQLYSGVEGATSKTYVASSTNDLTVTGLSGDVAEYSFTFATPRTITAGDVYVLVFKTDTDTTGSKYIKIRLVNSNDQPVQPNVENLRNYFITPSNWDSGNDHTWSIDPSPYTSTYDLTSKLELVSEMNDISNVPDGTRFEDTATRKIYRRNDPVWIERGEATPTLKVWYDADDSSTITESSDKVSQWNDKSGQGNHISQSSANQQPTVTANIQNGKPVIRFSESSDDEYMQRATWTGGAITQPFSVFFVGTYESTSVDSFRFVYDSGGSSDRYWASQDSVSSERRYNVGGGVELKSASGVVPPQTIQQYTMTYNGSSSSARKNGTDMVTGNAGTNSGNGMTIARRYSAGGGDTSTNMDMCELLIYEGALTDGVRNTIESYLQTKWGL